MKKQNILTTILGISIIVLILNYVGIRNILDLLKKANTNYIFLAVFCQFVSMTLWQVRWKGIVDSINHKTSFKNITMIFYIGVLLNNITPAAKTGGEPFKAYLMEKWENVSKENALATIAVDRSTDSIPFFVIGVLSIAFVTLKNFPIYIVTLLVFALAFNVFVLYVVIRLSFDRSAGKNFAIAIFTWLKKIFKGLDKYENKIEDYVQNYHDSFQLISKNKRILYQSLILSVFLWVFWILRAFFVFKSFGIEISFGVVSVVTVISLLVGSIPIFPGGLGSTDGTMMFLYTLFKIPSTVAVTASLVDRFISFWLMIGVGAMALILENFYSG